MTLGSATHQKPEQSGCPAKGVSEARSDAGRDEARPASQASEGSGRASLLQQALSRENLVAAWKHVKANKGIAGVDGRSIDATAEYLKTAWPTIREVILNGKYRPSAVLRVEIPKSNGGVRELGIPTVVDRLIQQALLQVLQPLIDPTFSESSFGFRPGRSAHDAVLQAQTYVQEGRHFVVDVDLEKFFDTVNHDILMDRLAKRVDDADVLRLVRHILRSGVMVKGVVQPRTEGTPQGGPLSPLLANVLLDEVDKALEKRGLCFARYADDCNVYVRSQRAGERILTSLRRIYAELKLTVNDAKTAVGSVFGRKFLGYCLRRWTKGTVKLAVAPKALVAFKDRVRIITRRIGGRSIEQVAEGLREYLPGWKAYFKLAQTPKTFKDLDSWTRHRIRSTQLKQWRRGTTIYRELRKLGASDAVARGAASAGAGARWWYCSGTLVHQVLTTSYFDSLGVPRLS